MSNTTPRMVKFLLTAVLLFCGVELFAQTITGKVTDQDNKPLPGVSVYLKGTTTGVMTDNQGKYSLTNRTGSKTIVFSCMGLKDHEEQVGKRTVINVIMEEDMNLLDETVVIGYQQVQRRDLMGAVTSADGRAIAAQPSTNFSSALSGKLAGVNVTTTEGEPDADVQIRVRGTGSITQDSTPLYIVDGFPVSSISDIAPQDIKSVDGSPFKRSEHQTNANLMYWTILAPDGNFNNRIVFYDLQAGVKHTLRLKPAPNQHTRILKMDGIVITDNPEAFEPR